MKFAKLDKVNWLLCKNEQEKVIAILNEVSHGTMLICCCCCTKRCRFCFFFIVITAKANFPNKWIVVQFVINITSSMLIYFIYFFAIVKLQWTHNSYCKLIADKKAQRLQRSRLWWKSVSTVLTLHMHICCIAQTFVVVIYSVFLLLLLLRKTQTANGTRNMSCNDANEEEEIIITFVFVSEY